MGAGFQMRLYFDGLKHLGGLRPDRCNLKLGKFLEEQGKVEPGVEVLHGGTAGKKHPIGT